MFSGRWQNALPSVLGVWLHAGSFPLAFNPFPTYPKNNHQWHLMLQRLPKKLNISAAENQ